MQNMVDNHPKRQYIRLSHDLNAAANRTFSASEDVKYRIVPFIEDISPEDAPTAKAILEQLETLTTTLRRKSRKVFDDHAPY